MCHCVKNLPESSIVGETGCDARVCYFKPKYFEPKSRWDANPIDTLADYSYAGDMEVHFSPEQEAQLLQIAAHAGTDTERLVKDAALALVDETTRFRHAVREGIAQANRGELLDDGDVLRWLERRERS